jgi:hypothetical protein
MHARLRLGAAAFAATTMVALPAGLPAHAAAARGTAVGSAGATSTATIDWAPAGRARIHPGVRVEIADVVCRAGFVLTDGRRVFLALPASCTGVSGGAVTDGCSESQVPYTLPATIQGARYRGRFVYSSFIKMQLNGATNRTRCIYNSLSLVKLDRRDVKRTNPSVPVVGGPTGVARTAPSLSDALTVLLTSPTTAQATNTTNRGWAHKMIVDGQVDHLAVGSPVLTESGKALGLVTYIPPQGGPGETQVSDFYRVLESLRNTKGFHHVHLARGTRAFTPAGLLGGLAGLLS